MPDFSIKIVPPQAGHGHSAVAGSAGLGKEARMNLPNITEGNWTWRFRDEALTAELARTTQRFD
jgi:hypothetical protein